MKPILSGILAALCFAPIQPYCAADAATSQEKIIHSFCQGGFACADGSTPEANLVEVKGLLYGATYAGGDRQSGVLFSLNPATGALQPLHSFGDGNDGLNPQSTLLRVKNMLYGTTMCGGGRGGLGCGAVFGFDMDTGTEATMYGFCKNRKCKDGSTPQAGLVRVGNKLYGTTNAGGAHKGGTVFSFNLKTHGENVVYSFDGGFPTARLIDVKGTLYGTATDSQYGTVFSINPATGEKKTLHTFAGTDGQTPYAGLVYLNGLLYGTTWQGGAFGFGTIFSVDPDTGAAQAIHSFQGDADGALPYASLVNVGGTLYGTTVYGGLQGTKCGSSGCGTVFSVDPTTGTKTTVYSFLGDTDGIHPYAGLIDVKGVLYGVTSNGGAYGYGTVFSITP